MIWVIVFVEQLNWNRLQNKLRIKICKFKNINLYGNNYIDGYTLRRPRFETLVFLYNEF